MILILAFGIIPLNSYADPVFTPEKINKYIIAGYGVAAGVDIATTQYGLGAKVVVEANPLQRYFTNQGPVVSSVAKGSMHALIILMLHKKAKDNPKAVLFTSIGLLAAQTFVDYRNAKVISNAIQ